MWCLKEKGKRVAAGILAALQLICSAGCSEIASSDAEHSGYQGGALPYLEQTPAQLHLPAQTTEEPIIAAWLPYFLYPTLFAGESESEARTAVRELLSFADDLGINTIFAHACAFGEAYYPSAYYPHAATEQGLDYMRILSEECASLGLSLHAWLNPLRLEDDAAVSAWENTTPPAVWYHGADTKGTYVVQVDDRWYLNPAYEEVRSFLCDAARELLLEYDIDGIHIDDYFYPTTDASFDAAAFSASGAESISAWRCENINTLLQMLYETVHQVSDTAVFSVSPGGNRTTNRNTQYADCALWCEKAGYCDWLIPQIYYGYENETMPFTETVTDWASLKRDPSVELMIGLAAYKVGAVDAFAGSGSLEWQQQPEILARQTEDVLHTSADTAGVALYHLDTLTALSEGELTALKAMLQPMTAESQRQ